LVIAGTLCVATAAQGQKRQNADSSRLPAISPQAQLALDELAPRFASEVSQIQGWFRDRPVLYYNFGDVPQPVPVGHVYWPIHGFDAAGNPVAMRGQRPIFSTIPGLPDYSGVWRLIYVVAADRAKSNELRDVAAIHAVERRNRVVLRDANQTLNLPIVARGSRLANDSTPAALGWYAGRDVQYFDFGVVGATPVAMWRFSRAVDNTGEPVILADQNSIVDSVPATTLFPDLWSISIVRVDSAYTANAIKNATALRQSGFMIDPPKVVRNLPITVIDGKPAERAPSPLRLFADQRSPLPPSPTRPPQ